ncbi:MAG: ComEC/Rec2 family competence protein [Phycisphaerales bacterium]|nr:ComEC/Rec2 family competence protein [Phycisphaerales bacterium]
MLPPALSGLLALLAFIVGSTGGRPGARLSIGAIAIAAALLGWWRHQHTIAFASDHIVHAAGPVRVLTRLAGTVVSAPIVRPPTRYNPYLPADPPPRTAFVVEARELRTGELPQRVSGLLQVSCESLSTNVELGDFVALTGWMYRPSGPRNPHQLDWAAIQRRNGIFVAMSCDGPEFVQVESKGVAGWYAWQSRLRATGRSLLLDPDTAGDDSAASLLEAIMLGRRSAVSAAMDDAFARTGAVHVLSVSGFHIGVLAGACWLITRYVLRRGNQTSLIGMLLCVLVYAFLAEPTAPVLRSVIMTASVAAAFLLNRPAALMNSICLASIVSLLIRPADAFSAGFQLSFTQVLALIYLVPPLYRRFTHQPLDSGDEIALRDVHTPAALVRRIAWRGLIAIALTSTVSWLIAAPLVAYHFQMIAPWAAIHSMLLTPLFSIDIVLGMLTMAISAAAPVFAPIAQAALHATASGLLALVVWLASWPGTKISVGPQPALLTVLTYTALVFAAHWPRPRISPANQADEPVRRRHLGALALICVSSLSVAGWRWPINREESATLTILAVGNGSAAVLSLPGGRAAAFDLGASSNFDVGAAAARVLQHHGASGVEAAVISHDDLDHFSGIPSLEAALPVGRVLINRHFRAAADREWPARDFLDRFTSRGVPIEEIAAHYIASIGSARLEVLWPPADRPAAAHGNDSSLALTLQLEGQRVLFPGDIEREALVALTKLHASRALDLRCDVLIAPHHGALLGEATAAFYRAAAPRFVVVSSGRDRAALSKMLHDELPGCRVLNTRDVGAVEITFTRSGELRVATPCARRAALEVKSEE